MKDSFAFAFSSVSGYFLSFFWHAYDVVRDRIADTERTF